MLTYFEIPSISTAHPLYQGQDILGLSLTRDRRNFTERDRLILNSIRPHIKQAHQNAVAFTKVQQQFTQLSQAAEQVGLIALSIDGKVEWMTQKSGELLHQYFPHSKASTPLPDLLQRWVNQQVSSLTQFTRIPAPQPGATST